MNPSKNSETVVTADAVEGSWVYRQAPEKMRPYLKLARLDRPIGVWLLLWPCWWSLALAPSFEFGLQVLYLFVLFGIGALAMRGAGCTYNDMVDRDFDGQVARTKSRPIPAGEVTMKQAAAFLALQCLIGLGVLLQLGSFAIMVGLGSLLLVAAYPFMKRITYWPQAWLGLTFNWGALVGWATLEGSLGWPAIILYLGGVFWTLGYDTVYAHQDREDDALIGVKSTALALGENTRLWIAGFYALFVFSLIAAGMLAKLGGVYYIGIALAALHLGVQVKKIDINDPDICLQIFRSNISFGWIVFACILVGQITK
ncbi:MAG: 4-hydroxybenzoate octaprenyltransferase [Kordiimonadales bacterium]|nr:MAG: 4-hydroxybenzoate octaprenyltransferase [Kordiimonadales bacterium]